MKNQTRRVENLLAGVELTGLEASACIALLREPGATAYRLAQLIGKPPPNTYKALDAPLAKDATGVHAAAWTRNPYLAMLDFSGMVSEFILTRLAAMAQEGKDGRAIDREFQRLAQRYMQYEPFVSGIPDSWLIHPKRASRTDRKPKRRQCDLLAIPGMAVV